MFNVINIIKKYDLSTKKKFGQNFLVDEKLLDKIVSVAGDIDNFNVLEIGPGPGGLTYSILKKNPKKLISVEIDRDYFDILKIEFNSYNNFEVIADDALKIDEKNLFDDRFKVIANLPYNIGTALLIKWMENIKVFINFTLLLQKEVVERIVAKPATKNYGRLTVLIQSLCEVKKVFDIKPTSFLPPPKVMSSVIYIEPKIFNRKIDISKLSKITLLLFNQRRKKIKGAIGNLIKNSIITEDKISKIDLNKRAEELTVSEYLSLLD